MKEGETTLYYRAKRNGQSRKEKVTRMLTEKQKKQIIDLVMKIEKESDEATQAANKAQKKGNKEDFQKYYRRSVRFEAQITGINKSLYILGYTLDFDFTTRTYSIKEI